MGGPGTPPASRRRVAGRAAGARGGDDAVGVELWGTASKGARGGGAAEAAGIQVESPQALGRGSALVRDSAARLWGRRVHRCVGSAMQARFAVFMLVLLSSMVGCLVEGGSPHIRKGILVSSGQGEGTVPEVAWMTSITGSREEARGHFILACEDGGFLQVGETGDFYRGRRSLLFGWGGVRWYRLGASPATISNFSS